MSRFFDPQPLQLDQPTTLDARAAHHAVNVLRLGVGDEMTLFNGKGGEWQARLTSVDKKAVTVLPFRFHDNDRTPVRQAHLWLPLIKGERLDWALQKATELGAASIQLYASERTEVRLKEERLERKLAQWRDIVISACEQCGLNRIPEILPPQPLSQLWEQPRAPLRLMAAPGQPALARATLVASSFTLLTGPEGGFSAGEMTQAQAAGFTLFSLGERVLRAETAPAALLAAIWALTQA